MSNHSSASINCLVGDADLDQRSRDIHWPLEVSVQRCPTCGLCARRIDLVRDEFARAAMDSREYAALHDRADLAALARTYLLASCVERTRGFAGRAAWFALSAGWVCDDARNAGGAADARRIAVVRLLEARDRRVHVVPTLFPSPPRGTTTLILMDMLRKLEDWRSAGVERLRLMMLGRKDPPWIVNAAAFETQLLRERDAANDWQADADAWCAEQLFASVPPLRTLKNAGWSLGQKPEDREPSAPALEVKPPSGVRPLFFWSRRYGSGHDESLRARWGSSFDAVIHIDPETTMYCMADAINAQFPAMHQRWMCDVLGIHAEPDYSLVPKYVAPRLPPTLRVEDLDFSNVLQRRVRAPAERKARRLAFARAALRKRGESAA